MMRPTQFVRARYRTGTVHLVFADGGPADGSLHGFQTLCGRPIVGDTNDAANNWREVTEPASCRRCGRCVGEVTP